VATDARTPRNLNDIRYVCNQGSILHPLSAPTSATSRRTLIPLPSLLAL
jgi:hypothetical protein